MVDAAKGTLELTTPNIPGLEGRKFGAEVQERLDLTVTLENDVNLAAVGERWVTQTGAPRDRRSSVLKFASEVLRFRGDHRNGTSSCEGSDRGT